MSDTEGGLGPRTTALEALGGADLSSRRIVVTGAASGIGVETARALVSAGAEVVLAVRDEAAGARLAEALNAAGPGRAEVARLDLSDRSAIAAFGAAQLEAGLPLHGLINNAGVMACPLTRTRDGYEMQFGTNHLGHFLMTLMLVPALEAGAEEMGAPTRVVSLSSIGHRRSGVLWDDPQFETGPYDKWVAYGQSKTANSLFAVGLTQRLADHGVIANAVMPGGIMTNLQKHLPKEEMVGYGWIDEEGRPNPRMKTPEQGAATSIWAMCAPELEGVGGRYLEDCRLAEPWTQDKPWSGYMPHAVDAEAADRLWRLSETITGFSI